MSRLPALFTAILLPLLTTIAFARGGPDKSATSGAEIAYDVTIDLPGETFVVNATMSGIHRDTVVYYFPIWGPGAYDLVYFGRYVDKIAAHDAKGNVLQVVRRDTSSALIIGADGDFSLAYRVHDIERLDGSPWFGLTDIEPGYVFANTVAIFGYPDGYKDVPTTVRYETPKGWDMTVGLDPVDSTRHVYRAADYDELVDSPIHMGRFQRIEFSVDGRPHVISITSPTEIKAEQLADVRRIADSVVRVETAFFGDMPYKRYVFQIFLAGFGSGDFSFGALEHRNSSSYRMPYMSSAGLGPSLCAVFAHEFWHLWSPKRIHVHQLGPFDYQNPPRTKSLWFAEGVTEYYARVMMGRHNLPSGQGGPRELLDGIFRVSYGKPQRRSVTDLSLHGSEVGMLEFVALYSKGPVIGLLLDAAIRKRSNYQRSLDDAMRYFNEHYGRTGRSFGDDDVIPIMEEATGVKLGDFYSRYIDGVEPLPFDEFLPAIGIAIERTERMQEMMGVTIHAVRTADTGEADENTGLVVDQLVAGGSAEASGVRAGDTIVVITMRERTKSRDYPASAFPEEIFNYPLSSRTASITVLRGSGQVVLPVKRKSIPVVSYDLVYTKASPEVVAARQDIFGGR